MRFCKRAELFPEWKEFNLRTICERQAKDRKFVECGVRDGERKHAQSAQKKRNVCKHAPLRSFTGYATTLQWKYHGREKEKEAKRKREKSMFTHRELIGESIYSLFSILYSLFSILGIRLVQLGIRLVLQWYYHRITMEILWYKIRKERYGAGSGHRRISQ